MLRSDAMSLIDNEQTKLLATALNTAATSCFTVGIATPVAGYLYNVGGLQASLSPWVVLIGLLIWSGAAMSLHLTARQVLRRLQS